MRVLRSAAAGANGLRPAFLHSSRMRLRRRRFLNLCTATPSVVWSREASDCRSPSTRLANEDLRARPRRRTASPAALGQAARARSAVLPSRPSRSVRPSSSPSASTSPTALLQDDTMLEHPCRSDPRLTVRPARRQLVVSSGRWAVLPRARSRRTGVRCDTLPLLELDTRPSRATSRPNRRSPQTPARPPSLLRSVGARPRLALECRPMPPGIRPPSARSDTTCPTTFERKVRARPTHSLQLKPISIPSFALLNAKISLPT